MSASRLLRPLTLFAAAWVIVSSPQAHALTPSQCDAVAGNLIQNCGFEVGQTTYIGQPVADWTVTQENGGAGESSYAPYVHSGSQALIFGGDPSTDPLFNGSVIISQSFADTAGDLLTFDFYLLNNGYPTGNTGPNEFQAFFDSTSGTPLLQILNSDGPGSYTEYSYQITATGSDSITFTGYGNNTSFLLDDVSVVETASLTPPPPAVTPEPSSILLLSTGLLSLGGGLRRRFM